MKTYVSEETLSNHNRRLFALFQFPQKVLTVELINLLHVSKYNIPLATQRLRYVLANEFRYVILQKKENKEKN